MRNLHNILCTFFIYTKSIRKKLKELDPLDPLTEIIKSGQALSPLIFLERLIWLLIGFFFIGSMTTGFLNGLKEQGWLNNKTFFIGFKKSDKNKSSVPKDKEENITHN